MMVPCPSGFIFEARKWKLGDIKTLLKRKNEPGGLLPMRMVELAAEHVVDPGPYNMEPDGDVDWSLVSHADIACANVGIRCHGEPIITMRPNCGSCGKLLKDHLDVDLLDLPIFPANDEGKAHLNTAVPIQRNVDGHVVLLQSVRGQHMATLARLQVQDQEGIMEILTCMGIESIAPAGATEALTTLPEIRKFWNEQSWDFRDQVETEQDVLFGGIDMSYSFTCDHMQCGVEQEQTVPLDPRFYGLDLEARQSRRAKRSSAPTSLRTLMQKQ